MTLSSSPRDFGSIANAMTGAGSAIDGIVIGSSRSASQSPARVSLSLATAPMSPGPNASAWTVSLPWNRTSWPMRSLWCVRVFMTVVSWSMTPWYTRKKFTRPAYGSARVLKT